jgi:hypothetical protein
VTAPTGHKLFNFISISFQFPLNHAGGRTSNVRQEFQIMKLTAFLLTTGIGVMTGGCDSPVTLPADSSPFHSIVVRDGAIVATLPPHPTWLVREGTFEPRRSKPEESFTMHAGSVIRLSERHSSYQVTAQITPTPGLTIEKTFDARSFGDGVTKRTFFIAAK